MVKTSGRILKSEDVIFDGQFHLDMGGLQVGRDASQQTQTVSVPAKACILENHPDYVVLEVTCTCGQKISVRCEYAQSKTADEQQGKDNADLASGSIN